MTDSIHVRVREARERQGRTVTEVARAAGIDHAHLYRFELGQKAMSSEKVDRILAVLGLDVLPREHGDPPDLADVAFEDQPTEPV